MQGDLIGQRRQDDEIREIDLQERRGGSYLGGRLEFHHQALLAAGHGEVDLGQKMSVQQRAVQGAVRIVHEVAFAKRIERVLLPRVQLARQGERVVHLGDVIGELAEAAAAELQVQEFDVEFGVVDENLGATRVHGLTLEDLRQKPKFAQVAKEFLDYISGAEVFIHNAEFDVEFLDLELGRCGLGKLADHVAKVNDTLAFARELHPGKKNTLDALCERYFVNNAHRTLHGALLDAHLLAEVYLAMTRGQESLMMELETPAQAAAAAALLQVDLANLIVLPALPEEVALHEQYLDAMEKETKGKSLWRKLAA